MEGLRIEDLRRAFETRDPSLVEMVISLAGQNDPYYDDLPEGAYTIHEFRSEMRAWGFRYKPDDEQFKIRTEAWARLEAEDADKPLPERFQIHEIVKVLHETEGAFARETLLELIRQAPLRWGVWRGLKALYKETELSGDLELYGALVARFDSSMSNMWGDGDEVKRATLLYLSRRGWRHIQELGNAFPAAYVDTAVAILREYPESTNWNNTWVANHVMFHDYKVYGGKAYNQNSFSLWNQPDSLTKYRAFADLWTIESRPLFALLERARSERARAFAIDGLKTDFKASLRDLDKDNVLRLIQVNSGTVQEFAVWLLENAPRFEQAAFKELGLHQPVLSLLDSQGGKARKYAVKYARSYARDMSVEDLLRLANHDDDGVRKFAFELLKDRDPRKDVGLEAWGSLLGTYRAHNLAVEMLHKHFGATELTQEWFFERFVHDDSNVYEFAIKYFPEIHKKVSPDYFVSLVEAPEFSYSTGQFAMESIARFTLKDLDVEIFKRLLLRDNGVGPFIKTWIQNDLIEPSALGVDYWRGLAYQPSWQESEWAKNFREKGPKWTNDYTPFDTWVSGYAREILGDVRNFGPSDIGFEWLMAILKDNDIEAREWSMNYMFEAFAPAEFADDAGADDTSAEGADLSQKTFLFTGKLATMNRKEAQQKVADANGKKAGSVTKNLDYLVVGDEGSPFFGGGSKGSKQKKADSLNDAGASINIISETAFLQMLAGGRKEYGEDDTIAGCENLWTMAMGPDAKDGPAETFARQYLRRHHDVIGQKLTDKTVEESRRLPAAFLTFERFVPLFTDSRGAVRKFALEMARWEMARWAPALADILPLCESRSTPLRQLFADGLLAEDTKDNQRLRIPPEKMDPAGVYQFCESLDRGTRSIGMLLIGRYPQFADPVALFPLTESPDRRVQAFVIKTIWGLYRDGGTTPEWKPAELDAKYAARSEGKFEQGPGVQPRPEAAPATPDKLKDFLRRTLFGLPPARPPRGEERGEGEPPPLAGWRAKLFLLETVRDMAVEDEEFSKVIRPLLDEFARTLGQRERGACLVAIARIDQRWEVTND